ncbi:hypothetical protein [Sporisorium scitamineum]|uniref:Uncharacterized protein n=1 Tax=Sporisorium scitamineum TaxID=49012 RepID=A0A0F7SA71_9BASI|nr:hypothetical protein [Sporisorium scitamineum]
MAISSVCEKHKVVHAVVQPRLQRRDGRPRWHSRHPTPLHAAILVLIIWIDSSDVQGRQFRACGLRAHDLRDRNAIVEQQRRKTTRVLAIMSAKEVDSAYKAGLAASLSDLKATAK